MAPLLMTRQQCSISANLCAVPFGHMPFNTQNWWHINLTFIKLTKICSGIMTVLYVRPFRWSIHPLVLKLLSRALSKCVSSFVDIDECETNITRCEQECTNTIGSYSCSCFDGYQRNMSDPMSCISKDYLVVFIDLITSLSGEHRGSKAQFLFCDLVCRAPPPNLHPV